MSQRVARSPRSLAGAVQATIAVTVRALIERVTQGESGEDFAQAARKYSALPLAEGWFAWALLTEQGEILEAGEDGTVSNAVEPLRTMFLVAGAERFPELLAFLPVRSDASTDCARCEGTGRMKFGSGKVRCHECRSLGWIEVGPVSRQGELP
jgi:hypothetical protein